MNQIKRLQIRCSQSEYELLEEYCLMVNRTKSDVVRELIRSLKRKLTNVSKS